MANAQDSSDSIFAQAIRNRLQQMRKNASRSSSSELVVYCQLIARATGGVPEALKASLGIAILDLFEELEVRSLFERSDIAPALRELGMTAEHLARVRTMRAEEKARRRTKEPAEA